MIKIKKIQDTDAAACYDVFHRAVHEGAQPAYSAPQRHAWAPFKEMPVGFAHALQAPCALMAVTDKIVGFITVLQNGYLDLLFVAPEHHRQGMATALYETAYCKQKAHFIQRPATYRGHSFCTTAGAKSPRNGSKSVGCG